MLDIERPRKRRVAPAVAAAAAAAATLLTLQLALLQRHGLGLASGGSLEGLLLQRNPQATLPAGFHFDDLALQFAEQGHGARERLAATLALRRRHKVPTLYHHIHKSGGSSMCNAVYQSNATLMSCKTVARAPPDELVTECNCNAPLPPSEHPLLFASHSQAESFLRQHKWADVLFEEDCLADDPYFGTAAVQVAVVRHPFARFLSHMLHERVALGYEPYHDAPVSQEHITAAVDNVTAWLRAPGPRTFDSYQFRCAADNYMTRFFAGRSSRCSIRMTSDTFSSTSPAMEPLAPVTPAMFRRALANMASMDAVLVLEEAGTPEVGDLLHALGLQPFVAKSRAGTTFSNSTAHYSSVTPAVQQQLAAWQSWDLLLYSFAQLRHQQLLAAWTQIKRGTLSG